MSVFCTLVLAQQQADRVISGDVMSRIATGMFFAAALVIILLYMFLNRPKVDARLRRIEQDPRGLAERLRSFYEKYFEWLPQIGQHDRSPRPPADV